jgi:hypothetical protein
LAGASMLAFLGFEICDSTLSVPSEAEDRNAQLAPEWEGSNISAS